MAKILLATALSFSFVLPSLFWLLQTNKCASNRR